MVINIMRASLLSMMLLNYPALAMDDIQTTITVQKSTLLNALDNNTPLQLNGKQYKVEGYVGGSFGEMFRGSGQDELSLHANQNKWYFLEDAGPVFDEEGKEISPGMDGVASFTLEEIQ